MSGYIFATVIAGDGNVMELGINPDVWAGVAKVVRADPMYAVGARTVFVGSYNSQEEDGPVQRLYVKEDFDAVKAAMCRAGSVHVSTLLQ